MADFRKLSDFIDINPRESLQKGAIAKKVAMEALRPFCRDIEYYEKCAFLGGSKFRNGDTIMARITPCLENGKTAMVDVLEPGEVGFGSTEFIVFRAKEGLADPFYVYYLICSSVIREPAIKSMVGSSGRQRVQIDVIANLKIPVHSFEEQRRIGLILKKIDDRIKLNNIINENLQQQAQAIYQNHFIDDGGAVTPATIADVSLAVTDGVHNTVQDDPDGQYLLLSCKNIRGGQLSVSAKERTIDATTFARLRQRTKLAKGDILISSVGTVGELLLLNEDPTNYEFQRSVAMIKPNTEIVSSAYLFEALTYRKAELINAAHGAVQQCLFISDIAGFPIDVPDRAKLNEFDARVQPMMDMITVNQYENRRLGEIRDTLLPKLMAGELGI